MKKTRSQADALRARRGLRDSMRAWLGDRRAAADKRRAQARKAARPPRGVDRVPERLRGLTVTAEPYTETARKPETRRRRIPAPTVIDSTLGTFGGRTGNHADRRARGQRGKRYQLRLRERRSLRIDYAIGEALKGREFATDEGERLAAASVKRWTR